jgi:transcription termination/antitermination protein NusA
MGRLKLDSENFGLSSMIERMTHAHVKDCFKEDGVLYVIVAAGEMGKILGKKGVIIKKLQESMGFKIKVIEFQDEVVKFVKNVVYPVKVEEIIQDNEIIYLKDSQKKTKSLLIGREGKNLKLINRAVKRFFNVEVKIGT